VLTIPESAVSSTLYSTMTLTFDSKLWRFHLSPIMHRWFKFYENVSNTLQDIVLTMFRDAHMDASTHTWTNRTKPLRLWILATLHWAEAKNVPEKFLPIIWIYSSKNAATLLYQLSWNCLTKTWKLLKLATFLDTALTIHTDIMKRQ